MEKYKQDFLSACEQAIAVDPDGADTQARARTRVQPDETG